jgi:curli biogenesis system outer membrane secretion channel CsgG
VAPPSREKTKVVVLRLENAVKKGNTDKGTAGDLLFGHGIRAQIVNALEQSGQFTVVTNTGSREVLQRDNVTDSGEIKKPIRDRLGSLGDAEFLIAGALTTYQLSKKSKNAGVEADLFFRPQQARTVNVDRIDDIAKRVFEKLKAGSQDRVALELWLFDAKTGRRLASTKIQGTPSDSSEVMTTAMQQAVHGSTLKAVDWITNTEVAFRAGTLAVPPATQEAKKTPGPEQGEEKVRRTSGKKQPQSTPRPRSTPKAQSKTVAAGDPSPTTSAVDAEAEDFSGSSVSAPEPKVEKTLPQEEWGEH